MFAREPDLSFGSANSTYPRVLGLVKGSLWFIKDGSDVLPNVSNVPGCDGVGRTASWAVWAEDSGVGGFRQAGTHDNAEK